MAEMLYSEVDKVSLNHFENDKFGLLLSSQSYAKCEWV